jgi:heme-degrading monooxygenase HmoA
VSEVVLINPFVVPAALRDEYLAKYHAVMERLSRQPGFLGGGLHRALDPDKARFPFINVNRWASAEAFHAGIAAVDPTEVFGDLVQQIEANPALFMVVTAYPPSGR